MLLKTMALFWLASQGQSPVNSYLPKNEAREATNLQLPSSDFDICFDKEYQNKPHVKTCFQELINQGYNLTTFNEELEKEKKYHRHNIQPILENYITIENEYKLVLESKEKEYKFLEKEIENLYYLINSTHYNYQDILNEEMYLFNYKIHIVQDFLHKHHHTFKKQINEDEE